MTGERKRWKRQDEWESNLRAQQSWPWHPGKENLVKIRRKIGNGNVRKLMMRRCKFEKIDGNGNVRNLMAMEMKMWEDLSARKPINTPEIVNVMIKAGPASTSNKIISNEPSQRNPFFWSKAIKFPCVGLRVLWDLWKVPWPGRYSGINRMLSTWLSIILRRRPPAEVPGTPSPLHCTSTCTQTAPHNWKCDFQLLHRSHCHSRPKLLASSNIEEIPQCKRRPSYS